MPSITVLNEASNPPASSRIARWRSAAVSALSRSCSAASRVASAERSFNTATAWAMVPTSSRRSAPGIATARSPSASRWVASVKRTIGPAMRRPSQNAMAKVSSATAATMPTVLSALFQVA